MRSSHGCQLVVLMWKRSTNLLLGPSGAGKSHFALALARKLDTGRAKRLFGFVVRRHRALLG